MDNQSTTIINSNLCTHITKLTKKNIQSLLTYTYAPICSYCKKILNANYISSVSQIYINLCLHCGLLFCNSNQCILNHESNNHIFWSSLKIKQNPPPSLLDKQQNENNTNQLISCTYQIYCKSCINTNNNINTQIKQHQKLTTKSEQFSKLLRFTQFINNKIIKLLQKIIIQFQQYQQLGNSQNCQVFGLSNLGNTCYLNSVLQILCNTNIFVEQYQNFGNKKLEVLNKQKNKRKQIQYFYNQVLQKQQSNTWHVVTDKKSKNKQKQTKRYNIQHFVSQDLIKDNKFNIIVSKFIKNIKQFIQIQLQLQNNNNKIEKIVLQPIQILHKLGEYDNKYRLKQQQDVQQLLVFIIDVISQGQSTTIFNKQQDKKQRYKKIQNLLGRQKLTPIQQIFGSYLASHVVCLGCNQQSWVNDFTYHYPVPLSNIKQPQKSIQNNKNQPIPSIKYYKQLFFPLKQQKNGQNCKILQQLFKAQRLTNKQNYYRCQKCQALAAIKQFYIVDAPQILVISLKRFQHNKKYKINTHVKFEEIIDISNIILRQKQQQGQQQTKNNKNSNRYQLYGLIVHKGQTITSGHYLAYTKIKSYNNKQNNNNNKSIWYEFSDDKYRKVTTKQVFKQQAYILFYNKINNQ